MRLLPNLLIIGLSVGAVLCGLLVGPATTATAVTVARDDMARVSTATLKERGAITLINRVRVRKGCKELRTVASLQTSSGRHASLMARARRLSHQLPGEPTLRSRTTAAGYTDATRLGEVIAAGPTTASGAVKRWLRSSSHRALLLDCRFRAVGAGYVTAGDGSRWWTVDLGRR